MHFKLPQSAVALSACDHRHEVFVCSSRATPSHDTGAVTGAVYIHNQLEKIDTTTQKNLNKV